MEMKIATAELTYGMYVSRLDRDWLDTPFLLQGFYVQGERDIQVLSEHCQHVYIDTEAQKEPETPPQERSGSGHDQNAIARLMQSSAVYRGDKPVEEEIEVARELREDVFGAIDGIMQNVLEGEKPDLGGAKAAVSRMTESILRSPDAFMWLRSLKSKDTYTYAHCIDSSALAIAFGRNVGLAKQQLEDLGTGALLFDVGKMRLPTELLCKVGPLTDKEFELVREHVAHSVDIMERAGGISKEAIEIAATHHERLDGSGYPRGLKGGEIPALGRMAAIVDVYDAITSETVYRRAIPAHEAVRRLYAWRGSLFQEELVEEFIQTLGTYPTGSVVELTTGEVGIVISQNRLRRLRPRVMVVLDKDKQPYGAGPVIDLIQETEDKDGRALEVFKVLEHGAYGIDPKEFYL